MKSFVINRNSYHYLLATRGNLKEVGRWGDPREVDFCEYSRCVLKGAFTSLVVLALISFFAFGVINVLAGIGFSLYYGMFIFSELAKLTIFITTVFGSAILFIYLKVMFDEHLDRRRQNQEPNLQPSFLSQAYSSWKDRYCVRVEFDGEAKT